MFKYLLLIISISTCSGQKYEKSEFIKAINLIYNEEILDINKKTLGLVIDDDILGIFNIKLGTTITIGGKEVIIDNELQKHHWIHFTTIRFVKEEKGIFYLKFNARDHGYEYYGYVKFEYYKGCFSPVNISYYSSIE